MTSTRSALDADWLGVCRRAVVGLSEILAGSPTTRERAEETGSRGSGGDRTLVIDRSAESVVLDELDGLREEGYGFHVISEERGELDYGDPGVVVIIDPIDGSLNAKRRISHYALSIAVADGTTMADVAFGFVYDFGPREEWSAKRGRAPGSTASGWILRCPSAAATTGDSRCSESSPQTLAGSRRRSTGSWIPRTGCGRWARSRHRCARSRPPDSTGSSRCGDRAASTPPPDS